MLTAGTDIITGTAGNDTINGDVAFNSTTSAYDTLTLGSFDEIDGGAGTDTLTVTNQKASTAYTLPSFTMTNVENLIIQNESGAITADVQDIADLRSMTVKHGTADEDNTNIDTKSNVTSVTLIGADADLDDAATDVSITDNGSAATTADTLATVTLSKTKDTAAGTADVVAISSDALTTLNVDNSAVGATVTAAAGTRALTINMDKMTGGVFTDGEATTLNLNATGTKSTGVTVTTAKATAVNIDAAVDLTGTLNVGAAKTIDVDGAGKLTVLGGTFTALESIDATGNTGGVVASIATDVLFSGGTGADELTVGATSKAITLGAGDDTFVASAKAATGGSIDGGDGIDTVSMTAADATTLSGDADFEADITNFEKISIGSSLTTVANTVNLANLDDINYLISAGVVAGVGSSLTVTNMASNGTFELTDVIGAASSISVKDSSTNDSDVLNIKLNGTANIVNTAALTVANVETINIEATDSSKDTTTLTNPAAASEILLTAADATTITVTGNHGVDFTGSTLTKVTTLDASGVVSVGDAAGATAAQIGTTGAVTFSSVVADEAVTVTTGNGADVIDVSSINDATFIGTGATASTISTGEGDDTITGSDGKDVIDGGAGNDTINSSAEVDTITLGAGNDKYVLGAATDSTVSKSDVIIGFQANTIGQGTDGAATTAGAVAADASKNGDVINIIAVNGALTLVNVSVFDNASDATTFLANAAGAGASGAASNIALDSSTGKLYMDLDDSGIADSVLTLQGVTTIDAAAFVIA